MHYRKLSVEALVRKTDKMRKIFSAEELIVPRRQLPLPDQIVENFLA
jgi:hypothetical protein